MRWLDRWLGVPLCFLLSLGTLWRCRRDDVAIGRPRKVLCIQLAEMGSLVLAGPAVHWLQSSGVAPSFVSFARNRDCLTMSGMVPRQRIFFWRTENPLLFTWDFLRFLRWAWRQGFDATIDFEPCSRFSALLGRLVGTRVRAGFLHAGSYRGGLYSPSVPYLENRHMSENFLALAHAVLPLEASPDSAQVERSWRACLPPACDADAWVRISVLLQDRFPAGRRKRLLLLNPNAGDILPQRRWPSARYIELARRLLERDPTLAIAAIGAPAEAGAVGELVSAVASSRCISLAGALSVAELPALFAQSVLLISNDSGPAHIAALTRVPLLVLFGPETPVLYRPLGEARVLHAGMPCSPCVRIANQRRSSCQSNVCMLAISVDRVIEEVDTILAIKSGEVAVSSAPTRGLRDGRQ